MASSCASRRDDVYVRAASWCCYHGSNFAQEACPLQLHSGAHDHPHGDEDPHSSPEPHRLGRPLHRCPLPRKRVADWGRQLRLSLQLAAVGLQNIQIVYREKPLAARALFALRGSDLGIHLLFLLHDIAVVLGVDGAHRVSGCLYQKLSRPIHVHVWRWCFCSAGW